MKWVWTFLFIVVYGGVVVGSFEYFKVRFSCVIFKDIDSKTCAPNVWVNSFSWPYNVGRELARWSYEREDGRQ
jgi:hypothetical protein